jgi:hypothetical protein
MINNRRVAAVICLHFGLPYLAYAMRSVSDVVDDYYIQYSPTACHGHYSPVPCPETQSQLEAVVRDAITEINKPLYWHTGWWHSEGDQFKEAMQRSGADIVVKLDADEIFAPGLLQDLVERGLEAGKYEWRIALRHYWRSFKRAVVHDPAAPGRVYFRMFSGNEAETYHAPASEDDSTFRLHHFGYALPVELMRYKIQSHGHLAQFRRDVDWLNEVYIANRQHDCHIVGSEYWNIEEVPVMDFLKHHPYADLEVIP